MKKIKFLGALMLMLIMTGIMASCDSDDVDKFTSSVVKHSWIADNGEVYDFYKYYNGVIFSNTDDYATKKIDKNFIWTETDDELSIGINGYRNEEGEMVEVPGEDMVITKYHIQVWNDQQIVLVNGQETITLKAYK